MSNQESKFEQLIDGIVSKSYAICDDFLSMQEVEVLKDRFSNRFAAGAFKKANIGKLSESHNASLIRGDEILWLESNSSDPAEKMLLDRNQSVVNYLNTTCYLGINETEIHFAKYPEGKFYRRHKDAFQSQKGRILSVIYYLNSSWVSSDGGKLIIYIQENGIEKAIEIEPIAGRMVCFKSELLEHEVKETFAERLSVTGWLLAN